MKATDFAYWLQGFFELREDGEGLTARQTKLIEKHLALVFRHDIDPSQGDAKHQAELNEIHSGEKEENAALEKEIKKIIEKAQPPKVEPYSSFDPHAKIRC